MHLLNARQRQPVQCEMNHRSKTSHWLCKNRQIFSHETGTPWILCRLKYALGSEGRQDILNPDPLVLWHSVPDLPTPYCIQVSGIGTHAGVHSPFDVGNCCCRKANGDNKRRTLTCCCATFDLKTHSSIVTARYLAFAIILMQLRFHPLQLSNCERNTWSSCSPSPHQDNLKLIAPLLTGLYIFHAHLLW